MSYFFVISHKFIHLYFANIIWLAYEFAISFFYCQNDISYMPGSLIFYLIVRLISHFCYSFHVRYGKTVLDFVYPDFKRDVHAIFSKNMSLKRIPLIFEIKSLFHWMSQDTYVKYNDFLGLGYLRLGLECTLIRKYKRNLKTLEKRFRIGILLLAGIAILIFLPLFFMFPKAQKVTVVKNTPVEAILSIGYTEMPKLYKRHGIIKILSSEEKENILNKTDFYSDLTYSDDDEIAVLTFKTESSVVSTLNIRSIMSSGGSSVPIISLKLYFNNTVDERNLNPVLYTTVMPPLTDEEITENVNHFNSTLQLATQYKVIDYMKIYQQGKPKASTNNTTTVQLTYVVNGNYWETNDEISIVVWCEKTERKEYNDSSSSTTSGLGLYILLLITFGLVLRYQINNHIDYFWFEKMKDSNRSTSDSFLWTHSDQQAMLREKVKLLIT
ncbi:hypothetical protein TVAG_099830 [Trichomonas vaginalis G3]|uniref:Uncharacterized protein n=1 Tax=Trichomonas vaginalis (strain ATCC PRA-98 / G3) TaxID=412133 RepID=A2EK50_TRIV3|nr:Piezo non-specific cation channel, R-Ras-binding domain family [Trichomonas vaginalis G3]EAY06943.1 hypothetical protein TVAG_099830 [Trichomonas vaginalis G3]KAI5499094.1 Piezo non-specific cation channel, R-Ras-binding domain family [Trichomonas vaginalis G3]|eukprot:XP_001319166.1 hypothetical protein [Trichomonas vaginalis G3]